MYAVVRGSILGPGMLYFRCKNMALNITDCVSVVGCGSLASSFTPICQCLSEEKLKVVGPFYLVSMLGEVKDPTRLLCNLPWTPNSKMNRAALALEPA